MGSSSSTGRRRGNTSSNNSSSSHPATRNRRAGASSTYPGQHQQSVQHDRWVNNNTSTASSSAPTPIGNGRITTPNNRINANSRGRDTRNGSNISSAGTSSVGASTISGSNTSSNNATTLSRPGAYSISREGAGPTQVFRVQIPSEVRPGQEFQVSSRIFDVSIVYLQVEILLFE